MIKNLIIAIVAILVFLNFDKIKEFFVAKNPQLEEFKLFAQREKEDAQQQLYQSNQADPALLNYYLTELDKVFRNTRLFNQAQDYSVNNQVPLSVALVNMVINRVETAQNKG